MVKEMTKSILQPDEKKCFVSGAEYNLDLHHIYAGVGRRKISDKWGCVVWLRHDIHMNLHDRDKKLDLEIKQACQKRFEELYGHEKFMALFGKNYL